MTLEAEILERFGKLKNLLGKLDVMHCTIRGRYWERSPPCWDRDSTLAWESHFEGESSLDSECGFNIKGNPKCHLAFDSHLLHQFWKYGGGLADKNEDIIKFHWKELRTIKTSQTPQGRQVKKMRWTQDYKVRFIIAIFWRERPGRGKRYQRKRSGPCMGWMHQKKQGEIWALLTVVILVF